MERLCKPPLWSKTKTKTNIAPEAKYTNKVIAFNLLVPSVAVRLKST